METIFSLKRKYEDDNVTNIYAQNQHKEINMQFKFESVNFVFMKLLKTKTGKIKIKIKFYKIIEYCLKWMFL